MEDANAFVLLAALEAPLLLAKHEACLGRTDEGFEDIVAAFPAARTVISPEACTSSAAFAEGTQALLRRGYVVGRLSVAVPAAAQ